MKLFKALPLLLLATSGHAAVQMADPQILIDEGSSAVLEVRREGAIGPDPISVSYQTVIAARDTASIGDDFEFTSGTLTWTGPDDIAPQLIEVPTINRTNAESVRSFTVQLISEAGTVIDSTQVVIRDISNLSAISVSPAINVLSLREGDLPTVLRFTRRFETPNAVALRTEISSETAEPGRDSARKGPG